MLGTPLCAQGSPTVLGSERHNEARLVLFLMFWEAQRGASSRPFAQKVWNRQKRAESVEKMRNRNNGEIYAQNGWFIPPGMWELGLFCLGVCASSLSSGVFSQDRIVGYSHPGLWTGSWRLRRVAPFFQHWMEARVIP